MKKSELKSLIREVIEELYPKNTGTTENPAVKEYKVKNQGLGAMARKVMENIPQGQPVDLDSLVADTDGFTSGNFVGGEELTPAQLEKLYTDNLDLHSEILTNPNGFSSKDYNQGKPVYL